MMRASVTMRATWLVAMLLPISVTFPTRAHAVALDVAVEGDVVHVLNGEIRSVTATITNLDTAVVFLNGVSSGVTPECAGDDLFDEYLATKPVSLGPGESWEGPLLQLAITAGAPPGARVFDLTFTGGSHPYAGDLLGVSYFSIDVSNAPAGVPTHPLAADGVRASPNPFRTELAIDFVAPVAGKYEVAVFDVTGRRVAVLLSSDLPAGRHHVTWKRQPGSETANGVLFVRVASSGRVLKTKVLRVE